MIGGPYATSAVTHTATAPKSIARGWRTGHNGDRARPRSSHRIGGRMRELGIRYTKDPDWLPSGSRDITDANDYRAGLPTQLRPHDKQAPHDENRQSWRP